MTDMLRKNHTSFRAFIKRIEQKLSINIKHTFYAQYRFLQVL